MLKGLLLCFGTLLAGAATFRSFPSLSPLSVRQSGLAGLGVPLCVSFSPLLGHEVFEDRIRDLVIFSSAQYN